MTLLHDFSAGGAWALATVLLGAASWRASRRMFPADALSSSALHALVLAWGIVVVASTALGAAGFLYAAALLAGVGAMASLLWLWTSRRADAAPLAGANPAAEAVLLCAP